MICIYAFPLYRKPDIDEAIIGNENAQFPLDNLSADNYIGKFP